MQLLVNLETIYQKQNNKTTRLCNTSKGAIIFHDTEFNENG